MKTNKTLSIALAALFTSSLAFADVEVSGKINIEHASLIDVLDDSTYTALKDDLTVRLFVDGDIIDGLTYHGEIQAQSDATKAGGYTGEYTQNAGIREFYVDVEPGNGWSARVGKQQVVWGTADGMKLLDIINPTDYAEMAQNQMEDSRIPVWMVNLEKGPVQLVISQPKENVFAGLNRDIQTTVNSNATTPAANGSFTDQTFNGTNDDNVFRMMGPDTITGTSDGFLNIVPDLGSVARGFASGFGGIEELSASGMNAFTVGAFENMNMGGNATNTNGKYSMPFSMANFDTNGPAAGGVVPMLCATNGACTVSNSVTNSDFASDTNASLFNYTMLPDNFQQNVKNIAASINGVAVASVTLAMGNAVTGVQMLAMGFAPPYNTNLANYGSTVAAEMETGATAAVKDSVFDYMNETTFATFDTFVNAKSQYVYDMPNNDAADIAIRFAESTKSGVNYNIVFSNNYDKNPHIDLGWYNDGGELLTVEANPTGMGTTTVKLKDSNDVYYGGSTQAASSTFIPTLRFTQRVAKVKNFGGAFDTSIETAGLGPVVIRGEALYTQDSKQPVINVTKLGYGDLVGALEMTDADRFKFVLGADITVLTNMLISGQYISDRNLDYVDNADNWTADFATMNMSNNFNKAIEDKQFYSLFFSKPFGASGQHRWNNILMIEEGGDAIDDGKWNRFDVDYGISDDVQASIEVNTYWGGTDTQFGQLKNASNMQVGVKYSF